MKLEKEINPRHEDDEKRQVNKEIKAGETTNGRPRNERREEKEREKMWDYEWRMRGKCLLCVCVGGGGLIIDTMCYHRKLHGKISAPERSDGGGTEMRERRRKKDEGRERSLRSLRSCRCISLCVSECVRVSRLCFSSCTSLYKPRKTLAIKAVKIPDGTKSRPEQKW